MLYPTTSIRENCSGFAKQSGSHTGKRYHAMYAITNTGIKRLVMSFGIFGFGFIVGSDWQADSLGGVSRSARLFRE